MFYALLLAIFATPFASTLVHASSDEFQKIQSALDHLGVPREQDSQSQAEELKGLQTFEGIRKLLPILDPKGAFSSFIPAQPSSTFQVFQDRGTRQILDFSVPLTETLPDQAEAIHVKLLQTARTAPAGRPLFGLKIALDPGHMGGDLWDQRTGKVVEDRASRRKLSEGVLALQVSMLLEQKLTDLGAEVLITRRGFNPSTDQTFEGLDLKPFGLKELRDNSLVPQFLAALTGGPAGSPGFFAGVDSNPWIRNTLSSNDTNRWTYFVLREDLQARARKINEFNADLALVIHFDAVGYPGPTDGTKVYVVGAFDSAEVSSRDQRLSLARHLLSPRKWNASLALGRSIVGQFKKNLGIRFDVDGGGYSNQVEPGIFARNLGVSRQVTGAVLSYLECLHYDYPSEFEALSKPQYTLDIEGVQTHYSDRLVQVVDSIQTGVVDFVKNYR